MQQEDWRVHSQSSRLQRLTQDWRQSSDLCNHGFVAPQTTRRSLLHPLEWMLSNSPKPYTLETLVISGYDFATDKDSYGLSLPDTTSLSGLRHLVLDFRIKDGAFIGSYWDSTWFYDAVHSLIVASRSLQTLDTFFPRCHAGSRPKISRVFDLDEEYPNLHEICLSFVAFTEYELRLFLDHFKSSLERLTIREPHFVHGTSWDDYVLIDSSGKYLAENHGPPADLTDRWGRSRSQDTRPRAFSLDGIGSDDAREAMAQGDILSRNCHADRQLGTHQHVTWPEDHIFAGATGTWAQKDDKSTLTVEWPQHRASR